MKKDILLPKVENVAIAIIPTEIELGQVQWDVYILNLKKVKLSIVIVNFVGYGEQNNRKVTTTRMRRFIEDLQPKSYVKIEPLLKDILTITNEYWVSFYCNEILYDKKYIFVAGSLDVENTTNVPLINKKGVMIM